MAWDFSTEPDFEEQLAWMRDFVKEEIAPLDLVFPHMDHRVPPPWLKSVVDPLKQAVKDRGLWACHLGADLGGKGFGQVKLSLMNEILAPYQWGPTIFGVQGPDTGNAEILAHYGTAEQKEQYLQPLLDGELFSAFSMTEPQAGADPTLLECRAERDGDEWVLTGEKFFTSNADHSAFFIVMAVTNPEVSRYKGMSMFLVPRNAPGVEIVRPTQYMGESDDAMGHPHVRYADVRLPLDSMLGKEGDAFVIAQTRLSGGRIHHAMRAVGQAQYAFDMMCERALSRRSGNDVIAAKQMVQEAIATAYAEIEQFRLFVLRAAWKIDQGHGYSPEVRKDIAIAKVLSFNVMRSVIDKAVHIHGALGTSGETPLARLWQLVPAYGIWDGPTETHITTAARLILKDHVPSADLWPSEWIPARMDAARTKFADALEQRRLGESAVNA
ncbi:acyl-CoA dehydrogenase family protein [Rhodococcus wratislaviensis]|uniref:Putative acyl-CoA dehydrogenase n=1 Tax=Rhodococcus wratislaviensis NBRC 100605 TaxID=1219028 RepID=X0PRJ1_RHOWR|nr:acyl-CoA dehydrogenase family protein [Rhodococcus wratislaviensis]GAF45524.1 putative acyl-CoA dehydrogenase [Rhodococcus wratislaviensis NBRC 100605]